MPKPSIYDLNKDQLWSLRQEIVLDSLFVKDYENSMGIDPQECSTFFEGYVEYLWELVPDNSKLYELGGNKYDNADNLWAWRCCIEL